MKDLSRLRNIGVLAHIDAGKTTLTERMLFYAGNVHRPGNVDEGNTVTDFLPQERERGITITSAAVTFNWGQNTINLIDTPGHVDFTIEVERSLKVLDGAVAVFDSLAGVQPQSETVWRQAAKNRVPCLAFVNKMDKAGADFGNVVAMIDERLRAHCVPIQIPVGAAEEFAGVIDLVRMEYLVNDDATFGREFAWQTIPDSYREAAESARTKLIESLADIDDSIAVKYLEGGEITEAEIKAALRRGCIERKLTPVLCGSAFKYRGVQPVIEAVIDYLPAPLDLPPVVGIDGKTARPATVDAPFCALAFKLITDSYGQMTFVRVYSGKLAAGSFVYNSTTRQKERAARLIRVQADKRQNVDEISAGDIAAVIGLRNTLTGHTLCDEQSPIQLEAMQFPEPVISIAIEAKNNTDQEALALALKKVVAEDPSARLHRDDETGQNILSGMGELHLEILVDRLKTEHHVIANIGKPQVAYRETITKTIEHEHLYDRQLGQAHQWARLRLRFEPLERGAGFEFVSEVKDALIPAVFIKAVEEGVRNAADGGVLRAYPMVDLRVTLLKMWLHQSDSADLAFRIAAHEAFRHAAHEAAPVLLEPVMETEVVAPSEYLGAVIGDLNARRGSVQKIEERSGAQAITAIVPLSKMFGYSTDLRSSTQGRGTFTMRFARFEVAG